MGQGIRTSRIRTVWSWSAAVLAFLSVGYALAILIASGYSAATDTPHSPGGVAIVAVLVPVPFIFGIGSYRRGRQHGLAGDALLRRVSLILVGVAVALFVVLGLLEGPV